MHLRAFPPASHEAVPLKAHKCNSGLPPGRPEEVFISACCLLPDLKTQRLVFSPQKHSAQLQACLKRKREMRNLSCFSVQKCAGEKESDLLWLELRGVISFPGQGISHRRSL